MNLPRPQLCDDQLHGFAGVHVSRSSRRLQPYGLSLSSSVTVRPVRLA